MVRENGFVVVHEDGGHAYRHTGRDFPVSVPDRRAGDAGETVGGAVCEAETFLYAGVEIRDGFELAQRGEGVGIRDRLAQGCAQFGPRGWVGEDVVCDGGHGEGRCFRTRDQKGHGLASDSFGGPILRPEIALQDGREQSRFGLVGLAAQFVDGGLDIGLHFLSGDEHYQLETAS